MVRFTQAPLRSVGDSEVCPSTALAEELKPRKPVTHAFPPLMFLSSFSAVILVLGGCSDGQPRHAPDKASVGGVTATPTTKDTQQAMTPSQALELLREGNRRFTSSHPMTRRPLSDVKSTSSAQYPFAVVLSCLDSRQPIELVLDQGIGDVFSARVAGAVLNADILGSMEFACKFAGAKLVAVLGHTSCGAIKGAVDNVDLGNLTELLAKVKPAIEAVPSDVEPRSSKNSDFVDAVAEENVRLVLRQIRERSPILREMIDQGRIGLIGGMYDLSTGEVRFFGD